MENAYGYLCGLLRYGNMQEYHRIISLVTDAPELSEDDAFWKEQIRSVDLKIRNAN